MKKQLVFIGVAVMIVLSGCGQNAANENRANNTQNSNASAMNNSGMNHSEMNHSSSGEVPKGFKEEENSTYKVGSQVIINADHMEGMNGATATIVGAYSTTAYAVSFTPTTGVERVTNHKWVIHEELKDAKEQPYQPGEKIVLQADHMKGMNGAEATIDTKEKTTVYMLDFTSTTTGENVKNHKWVTESELSSEGTTVSGDIPE